MTAGPFLLNVHQGLFVVQGGSEVPFFGVSEESCLEMSDLSAVGCHDDWFRDVTVYRNRILQYQ